MALGMLSLVPGVNAIEGPFGGGGPSPFTVEQHQADDPCEYTVEGCEDETTETVDITYSDYTVIGTNNYYAVTDIPDIYTAGDSFTISVTYGTFLDDAHLYIYGIDDDGVMDNEILGQDLTLGIDTTDVEFTPNGDLVIKIMVGSSTTDLALGAYTIAEE